MARLPMPQLLALSMLSFATMLLYVSVRSALTFNRFNGENIEVAGIMVAFLIAGFAFIIFFVTLKPEVSLRSATFSFLGANVGFGALFGLVEGKLWLQYWVFGLVPVYAGLVAGVLVHEGDPSQALEELKADGNSDGKQNAKKTDGGNEGSVSEQKDDFVNVSRAKNK